MVLRNNDLYEQLIEGNPDMEMFDKTPLSETIKLYACVFSFIILVILPWCVGCATLIKWFVF